MAEVMKESDDKQEDIVIVEDPKQLSAAPEDDDIDPDNPDGDGKDDERVAKAGETDDEREAIRERRRLEKLERKDRRDKAITRDKLELDFLRKRNDELERRMSAQEQRAYQSDLGSLDAGIQQAKREAEMADKVIAKAVEAGNGADVTQAMRYRDQALNKLQQLTYAKQQAAQRPASPPPQAVDDMTMHYAKQFLEDHKWYDPQGRDEDSAIVLAIDQSLIKDGFNPQTEDYWDELKKRAAKRMPERFSQSKPTSKSEERLPRGGPSVGSGREHAPASTRQEVYLSPERKQALIDAGVWDDPVLRMKYAKRYAEYDRANRA